MVLREVLNVRAFGARGLSGGAVDDGPAVSAVCAYIRAHQTLNGRTANSYRVLFPQDVYPIRTSIDCTAIRGLFGAVFEGYGAVLLGQTKGRIVFDLLNSVHITVNGLQINGDAVDTPSYGYAMGRVQDIGGSDQHAIRDVAAYGHFTVASALFESTETSQCYSCKFKNDIGTQGSYGVIFDGQAHFDPASLYAAMTIPRDTGNSFNEMLMVGMDVRTSGETVPVFEGTTGRHRWIGSFIATGSAPGVVMFNPGYMLDADVHIETYGTPKAPYSFYFTGSGTTSGATVIGLKYRDNGPQAQLALFGVDPAYVATGYIALNNLDLDVITGTPVFGTPGKFSGSGHVSLGPTSGDAWNGAHGQWAITLQSNTGYVVIGTGIASLGSAATRDENLGALGYIQQNMAGPLAAAGTNQSTASQLTAQANFVTTGTPAGGVRLQEVTATGGANRTVFITVWNATPSALRIYPQRDGQVMGLPANAPYLLAAQHIAVFWLLNATTTKLVSDQ